MLKLLKDTRIYNDIKYYYSEKEINPMDIPPQIKKSVCFINYPKDDGSIGLLGTGFFVMERLTQTRAITYCVTAKHIIENYKKSKLNKSDDIIILVNNIEGRSVKQSCKLSDWISNSDNDVSVMCFKSDAAADLDISFYSMEAIADSEVIAKQNINIGNEVFIAGAFSKFQGIDKIIPIMRFGHISAMIEEKVNVKGLGLIDAYLIETHSIGGLSGSPVFINLEPQGYQENFLNLKPNKLGIGDWRELRSGISFVLFGLITAHFPENSKNEAETEEKNNTGIAVVTPAIKIKETLGEPRILEAKESLKKEIENENSAIF